VALLARLGLDPLVGDRLPFLTFALAVVAVAWYGGIGPSLLALILGLLASGYFILPPRHSLAESLARHQVQVAGFLFLGAAIGLFSERLRAARSWAEAHAREAVRRREELEQEVAQRRRLEEELHDRAEELAEASRHKDEFLAMLSHELRNPLAPIRNAVAVMRILKLGDPRLEQARDVIERQVGQMARLVDDLLDVSRISRGKIGLKKERIELAQVIDRAVESSRPLLDARRHELSVVLPAEKVFLDADATRLAQVVSNLLNNASKYTAPQGQVRLSAERQGDEVVVRVKDNGVGITAEMLPLIFDLFTQANHTLDRAEGGLGIGLTLARRLVEMHGGSITAFSAGLGKGSEFVIRLPVARATKEPATILQGEPGASAPGGNGHLLPASSGG
jgi:signal transduction histidine kinase